jgi:triphosphoribosyl-dephospho-CoA synthetase
MNQLELQVLETLLSLLVLVVGTVITTFVPKIKAVVDKHLTAKEAQIFNHVVDGLAVIANAVVQQINQTVVRDAKAAGKFDAALAQKVREDAIAAVKQQGSALIDLGKHVVADVDGLIASLIEEAVAHNK